MYTRILVALDGSKTAEAILPDVEEIAAKMGIEVDLLEAMPSMADIQAASHIAMDIAVEALEKDKAEALAYLNGIAEGMKVKGITAHSIVKEGPAGRTILAHCREANVSVVAMTTHGRSGLRRTLFGSVADEVMRDSHLPVLMKRPNDPK